MAETQVLRIPVLKAVRLKCLDCSGGSPREVDLCSIESCTLHPFRYGKNPYRAKREMSDEQREATKERFAKARKEKKASKELPE